MVELVILAALLAAAAWALTERRRLRVRPTHDTDLAWREAHARPLIGSRLGTLIGALRGGDSAAGEPPENRQAETIRGPGSNQTAVAESRFAGGSGAINSAAPPDLPPRSPTVPGGLLGLVREW